MIYIIKKNIVLNIVLWSVSLTKYENIVKSITIVSKKYAKEFKSNSIYFISNYHYTSNTA